MKDRQSVGTLKNVTAMMFFVRSCKKFFPVTHVEIVVFPEGRIQNPNTFMKLLL